jgi:DNA-binding NtrC family response regulator
VSATPMPVGPTIIVVDDDEDALYFVKRSLKRVFPLARILTFESPAPALDALQRGTEVQALITDHKLGLLSGCDLIAAVRQRGHTFPVLMVTCSGDPDVAKKAYTAGATKVFETGGDEFADFLKKALAEAEAAGSVVASVSDRSG